MEMLKMNNKLNFYIVVTIILLSIPSLSNAYDRQAAYDYANLWYSSGNHTCGNYIDCTPWSYWGWEICSYPSHGGDCANFVSQSLIAGEHPYLNTGDPCRGYPCGKEEIGAKRLGDCLVSKGWERTCGYLAPPPSDIKIGDVLIYHQGSCNDWTAHATIVMYVSGSDVRIACHSANQWNKPYTYLSASHPYYEWLHYPDATTELIMNGGFESGSTGWVLSGNFYADSRFSYPHTGTGYAYLSNPDGTPGNNLVGTMYQTVTLPSAATSATLTFWYNITSQETGGTGYDVLNITIQNSSGGYLATVAVYSNLNKDTAPGNPYYHQQSFDMTPYKGQTVRLHFLGTTNASWPTTFRIDDVSILSVTTDVESPVDLALPSSFTLSQNYPNPFNTTTVISYCLRKNAHVRVVVYNLRGQKVKTLVDEQKPAGEYQTTWEGRNDSGEEVASGVYFYRMNAGDFSQTKKMVLLR